MFNRRERTKIAYKLRGKHDIRQLSKSYAIKKNDRKQRKEEELLGFAYQQENGHKNGEQQQEEAEEFKNTNIITQKKWYSLSVAIPGSILNNAQGAELKTYLAGQIARSCAVFCVDEVIIFDETARLTDKQLDAYYSGTWTGEEYISDNNVECNLHMARILEYLECPQYLRKTLFPMQRPLKFSGILNPLDGMHHLRADDLSCKFREGVVLAKPLKAGRGSLCDVGLDKELQLENGKIFPPKTRVTVELVNVNSGGKKYQGRVISPSTIRNKAGIYWGYNVRIAKSLSDVVSQPYDFVIGTSEKGRPISEFDFQRRSDSNRVLVIFGGLDGLEAAVHADEQIEESDPANLFEYYVNSLPDQGSRIIRTEEALPITLSSLKLLLG